MNDKTLNIREERRKQINLKEHKFLGEVLAWLNWRLTDMNKHHSTKKEANSSNETKALKSLSELRNRLDNIVCRDFNEKDGVDPIKVYYGDVNNKLLFSDYAYNLIEDIKKRL